MTSKILTLMSAPWFLSWEQIQRLSVGEIDALISLSRN